MLLLQKKLVTAIQGMAADNSEEETYGLKIEKDVLNAKKASVGVVNKSCGNILGRCLQIVAQINCPHWCLQEIYWADAYKCC